jgi:hypothetical protein
MHSRAQRIALAVSVVLGVSMSISWIAPVGWVSKGQYQATCSQWWTAIGHGRIRFACRGPSDVDALVWPVGPRWGDSFLWQDQRYPGDSIGFWLEAPLWPVMLASLFSLLLTCGLSRPRTVGLCQRCGYSLHGLSPAREVTCPECGARSSTTQSA